MRAPRTLLALAAALAALAAAPAAQAVEVYDVVIDGLNAEEVGPVKTPNIWALLTSNDPADRVTSYAAARSIMATETNPNHVAMMTGAYASTSGFVGNAWFDRAGGAQTSGEDARNIRVETLFTAAERQDPGLVTAGIFGKPKLGRIFATGGSNVAPDLLWIPCKPGEQPPPGGTCAVVPINPATSYAFDVTVMDEVLRVAGEGVGGRRADLVFVNLPDVDSAGHALTSFAPLYAAAAVSADTQVGRLITFLEQTGRWQDSVLIIHADHGMNDTPRKLTLTTAFQKAGLTGFTVVSNGGVDNVSLHDPARPDADAVLKRMREIAVATAGVEEALYRAPNAADGGSAHTVGTVHPDWRYADERAGDLVITAAPDTAFSEPAASSNPILGNHGHPTARAVPYIVAGGSSLLSDAGTIEAAGAQDERDDTALFPNQAENVDDAATIAALLGIAPPSGNEGRTLLEALALPQP